VDGWAISLIVQRLGTAYNALLAGQSHDDEHFSYLDFIKNDQAYLESNKYTQHERYWQEKFRQLPEPLIVARSAAKGKIIPSQRSTLQLKRPFYNQLVAFATENKASTFHVILGALYCYFVRTSNRDDFIIGLPTLNRKTAAFKQTVGLFVGVSPGWFSFGTDLSFVELLKAIGLELKKDYRNQRFPLSNINKQLGLHKEGRKQLFDITLSYAKHDYDTHFNGNPARAVYFANDFEQNALAVFVEEFHQQDDVNIYFDYNLGAFDSEEIERFKVRFEFLLDQILQKLAVPIRALQIMPDAELNQILFEFNDTAVDYPHDKTIVDLFEAQVEKTPNNVAVVFEEQQLTYQELNARANQLARHLQTLGVKPEVLVGICIERSLEMVIGLLGILKAGGAYLPLDPDYPTARLALMTAQVPVLLTQKKLLEKHFSHLAQVVCLDSDQDIFSRMSSENPSAEISPVNLVYVIYTSGSTGKPKGAGVYHRGFVNLVNWFVTKFQMTQDDSNLLITSFSFDLTQKNIFAPLILGGRLHLLPSYDPRRIHQTIADKKVTWLNCMYTQRVLSTHR